MILRTLLDLATGTKRAVYIRIGRNTISVRDAYSGKTLSETSEKPFTTRRLLVGDFVVASVGLEKLLRGLYGNPFIPVKVPAIVHQLEMAEDGLSPVEHRVLLELTETPLSHAAGIHIGAELSDREVQELAKNNRSASGV